MKLFISYRRADTGDLAAYFAERLRADKRVAEVFIDLHDIHIGEAFDLAIERALRSCDAILILIGPDWAGRNTSTGTSRIFNDDDIVRQEVRLALMSNKLVVPVLREGVEMPAVRALPPDLEGMSVLNAFILQPRDVPREVSRLVEELKVSLSPATASAARRSSGLAITVVTGLIAGLFAVMAVALLHNAVADRPLDATLGGTGNVWILVASLLCAGIAGAFAYRTRK